ncbi:gas vesicle protein GvpO, partial [Streptomyces nigra]
ASAGRRSGGRPGAAGGLRVSVAAVTSFDRTEDGWTLEVEVLELSRVPDTMSLMASYQVELDSEGQLTGYRRLGRYERGRSDARRGGR